MNSIFYTTGDAFCPVCINGYFYSSPAVCLAPSNFYIRYSLQDGLFFIVDRTGCHGSTTSGPNVLFNSNFNPLLFYTSDFYLQSVLSIFSSLSSNHHFSQFIPPPSLLYGKTFLMLYSASVKPGAYFLCPKLIANVRRDPPTLTSSLFGISSNGTWNIFVTILNPGVLCF